MVLHRFCKGSKENSLCLLIKSSKACCNCKPVPSNRLKSFVTALRTLISLSAARCTLISLFDARCTLIAADKLLL
eukprot:1755716-Karenia_brevis.AAC.1